MKSLTDYITEGILDDDFMDKADAQAEQFAKAFSYTRQLEEFIRNYFQKLYKEQFINIRELRTKNKFKPTGNPARDILVKDAYSYNSWIRDLKVFKTKFVSFAKSLDKDLPSKIDFDDNEDSCVDIYLDIFPDAGIFMLANFSYIEPGEGFFAWRKSDPKDGGVKLAIYAIDRSKLR